MANVNLCPDIPNLGITAGEYIQDIRDRDIRFLGISGMAGFLEDFGKHDYPASVRARWAKIDNVVTLNKAAWQPVRPAKTGGRLPKNKKMAAIVGTPVAALLELWEEEGQDTIWPAAAYEYRGVQRVGLLPNHFGLHESGQNAVAMLVGQSGFKVSMGLEVLQNRRQHNSGEIKRREIKKGIFQIPMDVEILDILPAEDVPIAIPLA